MKFDGRHVQQYKIYPLYTGFVRVIVALCFSIACFVMPSISFGQKGDYFLTHIHPGSAKIDNINFGIAQDQNGIICIANRNGVLRYDGRNWELIPSGGAIFALTVGKDNTIFAAGRNGFGKLSRDSEYNLYYHPLSDSVKNIGDIFGLKLVGDQLYAISENYLYVYDLKTNRTIAEVKSPDMDNFYGVFEAFGRIYVSSLENGLLTFENGQLKPTNQFKLRGKTVLFMEPGPEGKQQLIGTDDNRLYISDGRKTKQLKLQDNGYLEGSEAIGAVWAEKSLIAVGTLRGGVVFVNPDNGEVEQTINYHTGLPDNEVFAMAKDRDQGLWVSHEYGFTRVSPNLPFRSFSRFPGIEGNLLAVQSHDGRLYGGTSLGVYYLDKVENYKDIIYYVKRKPTPDESLLAPAEKETTGTPVTQTEAVIAQSDESEREVKGGIFSIFKRKKKRRKKAVKTLTASPPNIVDQSIAAKEILEGTRKKPLPKYETKIKRELQSVKYIYKQVEGIDAKAHQLVKFNGKLLAATLNGIFEIRGEESIQITSQPIRYLYVSKRSNLIFGCTNQNEVKVFELTSGGQWLERFFIEGFRAYIQHIVEDGKYFWLCSTDHIYKMSLTKGYSLGDFEEYDFENPYFDENYGVLDQGKAYFVNSSGYYTYDSIKDKVVNVGEMKDKERFLKPEKCLQGSGEMLWVHDGQNWDFLGMGNRPENLKLLNLFKDISYVSYDQPNKEFWIITDKKELFKVPDQPLPQLTSHFNLFLKEIRMPTKKMLPQRKFKIEQSESALSFEFVQPEYTGILGIEYKYKLKGLNEKWSEWSANNNLINFPYLPPGQYQLDVQTKDVFGHVNEMKAILFSVSLPYWRRPWFIALEVLLFGALMFVSFWLNRRSSKYNIPSRLLAFLTLILIVEFIQTIAESTFETDSSPVIDFFIQVSVAMMVLPLESTLRRWFFKGKSPLPSKRVIAKSLEIKRKTKGA